MPLFHFEIRRHFGRRSIDRECIFDLFRNGHSYAVGLCRFEPDRTSRRDRLFCQAIRQSLDRGNAADTTRCEERNTKNDRSLNLILTCRVGVGRFWLGQYLESLGYATRRRGTDLSVANAVSVAIADSVTESGTFAVAGTRSVSVTLASSPAASDAAAGSRAI